jgi:PA14 domain-containing protein/dolichyl-phosphate-mannose-protein mannosyltransferase
MRYDAGPLPLTDRRRAAARTIAVLTTAAALLVAARRFDPLPAGLRAQYFANTGWSGAPLRTFVDDTPSTAALIAAAGGVVAHQFSASWSGWIIAPRDDAYTFATTSDDGSWVYVDNQTVVDNGGAHPSATRTGPTIRLTRGPHALFIRYFQADGNEELTWLWQRGAGPFEPVPAWALRPRRIEYARFALDRALEIAGDAVPWLWVLSVAAALGYGFRPEITALASTTRATIATLRGEDAWTPLVAIVLASTALNVTGLWWGLPRGAWMGDELIPIEVLSAASTNFMHGWHDKYPPLHYYVLTLAYQPVLLLQTLVTLPPIVVETVLTVTGRLVSVVMAATTLIATFFCGRRAFGARAGLSGAALLALVVPFSYYAKAANVDMPYMMWFAICLVFYLRVLDGGAAANYAAWAAFGTLAVCSKDQAYGLLVVMPVAAIVEAARAGARAGVPRPWRGAIVDRRIGVATLTAIAVFVACHNLLLNPTGFPGHIRMILESESYRVYPRTLAGRAMVQDVVVRLVERNFGWPMFVVVVCGVVMALAARTRRRTAILLLVVPISYSLTFINTILFAYDRFLLPVCLVLSLFGGYAIDRVVARRAAPLALWRRAAIATIAAVFAYTLLYSVTVDGLMLADSRYTVEEWLNQHVRDDDQLAMSSVATYMPRLWRFNATEIYDRETFDRIRPDFYILNPDYTLTEPRDSELGRIIHLVTRGGGYRLVYRSPDTRPLRWLPGGHPDLIGDRRDLDMVSFIRNLSPRIEVYERAERLAR